MTPQNESQNDHRFPLAYTTQEGMDWLTRLLELADRIVGIHMPKVVVPSRTRF
jgi:hypothetical protein